MLLRGTSNGVVAITQPAHAWLAGELARVWGNAAFSAPCPFQEVCLAASLHDNGWFDWERNPDLDPRTGLPTIFAAVPATVHTNLWRKGVESIHLINAYAAVLVSMHGDTIYAKTFDAETATPDAVSAVRSFREDGARFQQETIANIRRDPLLAAEASDAHFSFNKRLIAAVDTMSLNICWGLEKPVKLIDVPMSLSESTTLCLEPLGADLIGVAPWPFKTDTVVLRIQGRELQGRFADKAALHAALTICDRSTIVMTLRPKM